jgi:hypothetical protein
MPVLILPPRYTSDSIKLWEAALSAGWGVHRLHGWQLPASLPAGPVAVYGEPIFAAMVAEQLNLTLVEPPWSWLCHLPPVYVKRTIHCTSLDQALQAHFPSFIKPACEKSFPARVYQVPGELQTGDLPPETPVILSEPVTWEQEFRCFVLDRDLMTASMYARHGIVAQAADGSWPTTPTEMAHARAFINTLLADSTVTLPASVVVDVGLIQDRGWAVVEANPAWGAGIYGCDPTSALQTIARACLLADLDT